MTLPCPATASIVPDDFDLGAQVDEPPVDYQPTAEDLEAIAAANLDSFLPRHLPFADWLAQQARQTALLDDERHQWLSGRIGELASQASFLGARDPEEFVDRDEAMLRPSGRRGYRRPWIGPAVASIAALADQLAATMPESAAILRRDLRTLELAAGGAR
jgi:hypothetical protein